MGRVGELNDIIGHGYAVYCQVCGNGFHLAETHNHSLQLEPSHKKGTPAGFAPLLLRLLIAYGFLKAGLKRVSGENWFADLAFPFPFNLLPPDVSWGLSMGLEIIAPVALILGFATRFFSFALIILTIVAIAAVHWPAGWHTLAQLWQGYAITDQGYGNYNLPLMYLFMLTSLLFSGSGRLSLDAWLTLKTR